MRKLILITVLVLIYGSKGLGADGIELTLEESISIALEKNKSLAVARERLLESQAKVGEAWTNFLPKLSSRASYTRLDVVPYMSMKKFPIPGMPAETFPRKIEIGDDDIYNTTISVQQPLFTGFSIMNGYRISQLGAEAEWSNFTKTKNELKFNVKRAYFGLLKAEEFARVSEEAVEQMEAHIQDLENMYAAGLVAKNDLLKGKVQLSNVRLMRVRAHNGVKLTRAGFLNVLGLPLNRGVKLKEELRFEPAERIDLEDNINRAVKNRPEVEAMGYSLEIGEKLVSLSRAKYLPNVFMIGNYDYKRPNREYEPKFYGSWNIVLVAQFNIFDWGAIHQQTAQAKHRYNQLREGMEQLKDGITLEVTQAYLSLTEAQKMVEISRENIAQAEENYRVTDEKFKQGAATNTDLLDANTLLTQAKMDYVAALADYQIARAQLELAMGK